MPELTTGSEYLVAFLHSAGTAAATGMGLTGLSWQELEAWVRCTDSADIVTSRDLKVIHTLSRVYANEMASAAKKTAKPPYIPPVEDEDEIEETRAIVSEAIDDLFGNLMASQERG